MKLFECFILFLGSSVVYHVSAQEATSTTSKPLAESTTSAPVTELNSSSTTIAPSSSTPPPTVSPVPESSSSNKPTPESTTNAPTSQSEEIYLIDDTEPSELMLMLNDSGIVCVLLKMEVTLTLEYKNASDVTVTGVFPVTAADVDKTSSSRCQDSATDETENLYATFNMSNSLNFNFNRTSKDKFAVSLLQLSFKNLKSLFSDAKDNQSLSLQTDNSIFETSTNMSYKCDSETKVKLMDSAGNATNSFITFKMVQMEAFRTSNDTNFSSAMDCAADEEISNIVPIAVGCALAGLVVIVLIAYLVGRRQKRQRGYESV